MTTKDEEEARNSDLRRRAATLFGRVLPEQDGRVPAVFDADQLEIMRRLALLSDADLEAAVLHPGANSELFPELQRLILELAESDARLAQLRNDSGQYN